MELPWTHCKNFAARFLKDFKISFLKELPFIKAAELPLPGKHVKKPRRK